MSSEDQPNKGHSPLGPPLGDRLERMTIGFHYPRAAYEYGKRALEATIDLGSSTIDGARELGERTIDSATEVGKRVTGMAFGAVKKPVDMTVDVIGAALSLPGDVIESISERAQNLLPALGDHKSSDNQ